MQLARATTMKFEDAKQLLDGIPFIDPQRARTLYDFILETRPQQCLELGFAHGTSSCYIAAALDEIGSGHLTSVDLTADQVDFDPSLETLLEKTGLGDYVTIQRERNSYTWFLKKAIEANTHDGNCQPVYDFCFIDGAKNWTIDGMAFFLVDKLLKMDGWILFDDMNWTYAEMGIGRDDVDGVTIRSLSEDERRQPHIERIFSLLVMQHPDYGEFKIEDDVWGWAHKIHAETRTLRIKENYTLSDVVMRGIRRVGRRLTRRVEPIT